MGEMEEACFPLNPSGNCLGDLEQLPPPQPGFNVIVKEQAVNVP